MNIKKNSRGFTLVELMIAISVVIIVVFVGVYLFGTGSRKLEDSAFSWAQGMGYSPTSAMCSKMDSDGDTYVSCAIRVLEKEEPIGLECNWITGDCKLQIPGW